MTLKFWCPKCGAQNVVSNSHPGSGVACVRCGKLIEVPRNCINLDEKAGIFGWLDRPKPPKAAPGSKAEQIEKRFKRWHFLGSLIFAIPIDIYIRQRFGNNTVVHIISYMLGYLVAYTIGRIYQETLEGIPKSQLDAPAESDNAVQENREAIIRQIIARKEKKKSISRRLKID
jgi:hypothetical protein